MFKIRIHGTSLMIVALSLSNPETSELYKRLISESPDSYIFIREMVADYQVGVRT
jgi:hypothetical protein